MAWTQELKDKIIAEYQERDPTPETSMEIVKELAEKHSQTANGVRMVLSQAKVYVVKGEAGSKDSKSSTAGKKSSEGSKRVSKEDSIKALKDAIEEKGKTVDDEILDKLTGKAAVYLLSVIQD